MSTTLSQFIAADLTLHPPAPDQPLTLAALAARYKVSLTPVRQAVRELIAAGVLGKSATGRLCYLGSQPALAPTLPRRAWEAELRRDVLHRSLLGDQEFLREEALAEHLAIGRTVLRQELHRLAGQGFVEHVPRCGWRARTLTLAEVEDWLRIRERLELLALELAWPHLEPETLTQLRDSNAGARLDNALHGYLIECAQSPLLATLFTQHGAYFTALFDHAAPETRMEETMAAQHRAILEALLDRDLDRATATLSAHIRAQRRIVEKLLGQLRGESEQ
ncbi:GntR family transcriptional regulator [Armatimonas rosea]|uniref:DNA-binding GntR family transcriptional regulator n=1 Tax=Armatimonas rosea TaxID=685828 RepID=A0A7W9SL51_ARMRO|nr:GntR family transcriptional regulator [Armatimonas rosea]MBB6048340.1 DNA-binding GntR family transcriptional regulator [Armatimonas rosea]